MMQKKRKKRKRKQEHQELQVLQVLELLEKQAQDKEKVKDQVLVQLIQDTITHFKNNKKIKQQPRKQ
jgi:hemerythrin